MKNTTGKTLKIIEEDNENKELNIVHGVIKPNEIFYTRTETQQKAMSKNSLKVCETFNEPFIKATESLEMIIDFYNINASLYCFASFLAHFIEIKTNFLKINGEKLTIENISQITGLSYKRASSNIGALKKLGIIKNIKTQNGSFLVMNPYFRCKGQEIIKATLTLFKEKKNGKHNHRK